MITVDFEGLTEKEKNALQIHLEKEGCLYDDDFREIAPGPAGWAVPTYRGRRGPTPPDGWGVSCFNYRAATVAFEFMKDKLPT
jgi:hypothetical protein